MTTTSNTPAMVVKTESGSTYEVRDGGKAVRRVPGACSPALQRLVPEEWRACERVTIATVGGVRRLVITYSTADTPRLSDTPDGVPYEPMTVTSPIVSIEYPEESA